jgi:hypothetical protein
MPETNACALAAADLVWLLQDCTSVPVKEVQSE